MPCSRRDRFRHLTGHELSGGLVVGAFFGCGMLLQVYGLKYTLPSVSSFLTAPPIYAPLGQWSSNAPVGRTVWTAVGIAVLGIVILSVGGTYLCMQGLLCSNIRPCRTWPILTYSGNDDVRGRDHLSGPLRTKVRPPPA